jgi:hypothetical protein
MISIVRLMPAHSNVDPILMMDAARRRLNYLGPPGFRAMAGQTNDLFRQQGYLEFPLASPLVPRWLGQIEEVCGNALTIMVRPSD